MGVVKVNFLIVFLGHASLKVHFYLYFINPTSYLLIYEANKAFLGEPIIEPLLAVLPLPRVQVLQHHLQGGVDVRVHEPIALLLERHLHVHVLVNLRLLKRVRLLVRKGKLVNGRLLVLVQLRLPLRILPLLLLLPILLYSSIRPHALHPSSSIGTPHCARAG